jgi:Sulfatase
MPATHKPHDPANASPWFEDLVILLTLVAFAVAQTVYDLITANPDLLAARRVTNAQLLAIVGFYGLLPAAVLGTLWVLCRRLSPLLHRAVFCLLIFGFSLALGWQIRHTYLGEGEGLSRSPWWWLIPAIVLAFLAWRKERGFRSFLTALSPAVLIFPALFLYHTWRSPIAPPPLVASVEASSQPVPKVTPNGTPVFVLVFDELALHVLLDADGKIDAQRYPTFAKLSGESHWFRNATSNSSKTITAIAAIATGNMPSSGNSNHTHYPNTMFSLLAPFYDIYIEEVGYTNFCDSEAFYCLNDATGDGTRGLLRDLGYLLASRVVPAKIDVGLPDTSHTWGPFQSAEDWTQAALARCRRVLRAVDALPADHLLFFAHLILPHSPYALTPDGKTYAVGPYALDEGMDTATLDSLLERYRMQVRYVDHYLGEFLERLKQRGLYDPALLIVTADHGVSWKPQAAGRTLRQVNGDLMLPVPLFVKLPFEKEPVYSERDVQHIDLVPTIADVLETPLPFAVKGRSVFAKQVNPRLKVAYGDGMERFEFDDRLGMRHVEAHAQAAPFVGESFNRFRVVEENAIRGKLEAMQITPPGTPDFAAALPVQISGWALRLDPGVATIQASPQVFRSGKQSLAFQGGAGGARQMLSGLTPGNRYQASAWVRAAAAGGQATLVVSRPGVEILKTAAIAPTAKEFRNVELEFTAPVDGQAMIDLQSGDGPGAVYWDDVSVSGLSSGPAGDADTDSPAQIVANGGFEEQPLGPGWAVHGEGAPPPPEQPIEVVVTLNGEIVAATRPGAERWDVAGQLLSPGHHYLRCGWSVSIPIGPVREGENPLQAYAVIDPEKRLAVRLDSGWPRILVKRGNLLDRKMP